MHFLLWVECILTCTWQGGSAQVFFGIPKKINTRKNQTQKINSWKLQTQKSKYFVHMSRWRRINSSLRVACQCFPFQNLIGFQWAVKIIQSDTQKNKFYQNYYLQKISEKSSERFSKPKKIRISKISDPKKISRAPLSIFFQVHSLGYTVTDCCPCTHLNVLFSK